MQGRIADKIKYEKKIQCKINNYPDYVFDYYLYLNEKTYLTKMRYINNVLRFLDWYKIKINSQISIDDLNNVTPKIIQNYISDIQYIGNNKELGDDAKSNIYSSLNSFFVYLKTNKLIEDNPFDEKRISRPKTHDNEIVFLEPEEYSIVKKNIMSGVGNQVSITKQKKWMYRDLLIFQILIITGVRVTALSQICLEDINMENGTIKVIDKARDKTLYLDNETIGLLLIWLEQRSNLLNGYEDPNYLFFSNRRTKMDVSSIENIIEKYTYNINKHITPHKLRSTCGTNMYRATKDIYIVAETLGHKSPATSRKYTKVGSQDRINATQLLAQQMKMQ